MELQWKGFYLGILELFGWFDSFLEEHKNVSEMLLQGLLDTFWKHRGWLYSPEPAICQQLLLSHGKWNIYLELSTTQKYSMLSSFSHSNFSRIKSQGVVSVNLSPFTGGGACLWVQHWISCKRMVFLCQIPVSGFMTMGYISQDITYKSAGIAKKRTGCVCWKAAWPCLAAEGQGAKGWEQPLLLLESSSPSSSTAWQAHTLSCRSSSFGFLKLGRSKIDKRAVFFCCPSNLLP